MPASEFTWVVPVDHPAFPGHFPGRPIVPGVVLLDQAIRFAEQLLERPGLNWQVGNAKFFSPVQPCEVLSFALEPKPSGSIAFTIRTPDRSIASGSLTPP
jgi:3-hydroxymyristoyl/3-hydroxydecanoyl-(acyl carrier protein) dehydratase